MDIPSTPAPTAVSVLTAPGTQLARLSSLVPQSVIDSASPADLASLSKQASALSEANILFGSAVPNLFQTPDSLQQSHLALLEGVFGVTPAASPPVDLLQQGLDRLNGTQDNLQQSLLSLFGDGASSRGNLVDIFG